MKNIRALVKAHNKQAGLGMSFRFPIIIAMLAAITGSFPALADIYSFRDENGVLNFTNIRPNDAHYKVRVAYKEPKPVFRPTAVSYNYNNGNDPVTLPPRLDALVDQIAGDYAVDKALVQAVIHAESAFNARAISPKGASGLMQLMPETAERYGVRDIFDPEQNIMGGVHYLRDLLETFGNNLQLALAAYNAGENSVLRYGGIPPFPETINYVNRVLKLHDAYRNRG
jgi:soluble lytic murein transglycosylase-like protein